MTKSEFRKLLTKPKFRAWLEGKKPRVVVGVPHSITGCPIGRYVGGDWVDAHYGWHDEFATEVDDSGFNIITAFRALKILDGIQ